MRVEYRKITIVDIARLAGVSTSTVPRVINDKRKGIAAKTKKRVLRIIEKYDYYPDTSAQYLGKKNRAKLSQKSGNASRKILKTT